MKEALTSRQEDGLRRVICCYFLYCKGFGRGTNHHSVNWPLWIPWWSHLHRHLTSYYWVVKGSIDDDLKRQKRANIYFWWSQKTHVGMLIQWVLSKLSSSSSSTGPCWGCAIIVTSSTQTFSHIKVKEKHEADEEWQQQQSKVALGCCRCFSGWYYTWMLFFLFHMTIGISILCMVLCLYH